MGRGRQKAKQTKVARKLKYEAPRTDFASLERELTGKEPDTTDSAGDDQQEHEDSYEYDYGYADPDESDRR